MRAFKQGQQALQKGGTEVDVEDNLKRIEQSLYHLFDGLIAQRQQIGAGVAVDVVGHGLAAKSAKIRLTISYGDPSSFLLFRLFRLLVSLTSLNSRSRVH